MNVLGLENWELGEDISFRPDFSEVAVEVVEQCVWGQYCN